jgi:hypothetical protein
MFDFKKNHSLIERELAPMIDEVRSIVEKTILKVFEEGKATKPEQIATQARILSYIPLTECLMAATVLGYFMAHWEMGLKPEVQSREAYMFLDNANYRKMINAIDAPDNLETSLLRARCGHSSAE